MVPEITSKETTLQQSNSYASSLQNLQEAVAIDLTAQPGAKAGATFDPTPTETNTGRTNETTRRVQQHANWNIKYATRGGGDASAEDGFCDNLMRNWPKQQSQEPSSTALQQIEMNLTVKENGKRPQKANNSSQGFIMAGSSVSDKSKAATTLLSNELITQSSQAATQEFEHTKQDSIFPPLRSTNLCQ